MAEQTKLMQCRLCGEPGVPVSLFDGSVVYECPDDCSQSMGLASLIADRVYTGFAAAGPELHEKIYRVTLDAIRKANR